MVTNWSVLEQYLTTDEEVSKCGYELINSSIFSKNRGYVRRKLISLLILDELDYQTKALIGAVLLIDGKRHQSTLEMLQEEAASSVVISILWHDRNKSLLLHRIYLELLFEMCKVQKLRQSDLEKISIKFLEFLFSAVQNKEYSETDPYNYAVMKVILALNEQYMINDLNQGSLENRVFEVLKDKSNLYRAFGENLVFLFNRGIDDCLQLMMMKFLYLVFTTPETYQYIYLNDLKVLVGVCIREIYDLSADQQKLRHTYLRILHPLLQNTQLREDHYKRNELVLLLESLANESETYYTSGYDDTTKRLASRCLSVPWLGYTVRTPPDAPEITLTLSNEDDDNDGNEITPSSSHEMDLSPVSSHTDSESNSSSNATTTVEQKPMVPPARKRLAPPVPSPRKLCHMTIRNSSALEIATLSKDKFNS